ncbi:MAG TPA: BadF/BadG/BcrA/BcrD ATPase family protein [Pyrinomonadaceae bacterium]|nr:BadF/BadG/BcrA/BcrD ATPase family protein [Pyrinomonadaceae bacterium]
MTTERRTTELLNARRVRAQHSVVGVDGGGSKTEAVIIDSDLRVIGEGRSGPSNPLRVGLTNAAAAVREAIDNACASAKIRRSDVEAAEVGLAGARRHELRERMREILLPLGIREIQVVTDADIALYGATDGAPGLVVIAGTGSICCGINARGKRFCAGGWGPLAGDEGAGAWIARQALRAVAYASDGRGPETLLTEFACNYFHVSTADDLTTAIYAPTITNERIAGFGKDVVEAAKRKDPVAEQIILEGGIELGVAAVAVIRNLQMERERFQIAFVGGVFRASAEMITKPLKAEVAKVAPRAYFEPPHFSPAVAAARMARERINNIALAV